ncbi:StsA-related sactipeptide RiPP [Actinoplanes sp. N902-109]|uniref:StsA-related sactipeptide RiPP n=1 Tax=Actinoplanes sp. (strain N902-109) TaxID=649831 RepID=UPI0003294F69|nr:StsA-related sactipeptide RiPP [Actinoplanes sp. N902-109]AGL17730.1 hypothetical protein L083_4220 [Actinoplanes sp. N902-109]
MTYNSAAALREAGIIGGPMSPELEEFYASLTQQETEVLISTKNRLVALFPDVAAHSQDWSTPEATGQELDAAMLCACAIWSGAGQAAN